jgi:hypothetical protein
MTKPIARDWMYRKRVFDADIIELCVRWYITYRLSYRDLVEMMAERGVQVVHSTILRWVTGYVPEFVKRRSRCSKAVGTSWRVDETYISIKAKWHYLYGAIDKQGTECRPPAPARPWHRGGASVLSQSACLDVPSCAPKSDARWPRAESTRAVAAATRAPVLAERQGSDEQVSEQPD